MFPWWSDIEWLIYFLWYIFQNKSTIVDPFPDTSSIDQTSVATTNNPVAETDGNVIVLIHKHFDIYLKLVMKILCKNSCVFENKHFS